MHKKFKLTIRTPEETRFEGSVESLYLTTETGDMMFLADYAAFSGVVSFSPIVVKDGDEERSFVIRRGVVFFSYSKNECVLLAQNCDTKDTLDFHAVEEYLKFIDDKLAQGKADELSDFYMSYLENERVALVKQVDKRVES